MTSIRIWRTYGRRSCGFESCFDRVWCARNEGYPPKEIDDALRVLMKELEPARLYQANSADGRGCTQVGRITGGRRGVLCLMRRSRRRLEACQSRRSSRSTDDAEKDRETINDDWAEHDFAKGASGGDLSTMIAGVWQGGEPADFVRKSQLANYEAFRAMYEDEMRSCSIRRPGHYVDEQSGAAKLCVATVSP
jgi:beta-mannosidase